MLIWHRRVNVYCTRTHVGARSNAECVIPLRCLVVQVSSQCILSRFTHTNTDFGWIERIWGGRPARQNIVRRPPGPGRRRENPRTAIPRPTDPETVPVNPATGDQSSGEFWWRRAVEKHVGAAGALSQAVIPWEALCTHSLGEYFTQVLGDEGRHRPLRVRIAATVSWERPCGSANENQNKSGHGGHR